MLLVPTQGNVLLTWMSFLLQIITYVLTSLCVSFVLLALYQLDITVSSPLFPLLPYLTLSVTLIDKQAKPGSSGTTLLLAVDFCGQ